MQNKGKLFEQDFKKSLEDSPKDLWVHRPSDFGGGQSSRFTNHSLCDYEVFDKEKGILYFFELKSKQNTSFSCPPAQAHYRLVEQQKIIDELQVKEDKKAAQKTYKELLKAANQHDIKYHQIQSLLNIQKNNSYNNMSAYFILNFRKYNKTFAITPEDLCIALLETKKSSINLEDVQKYKGIEIPQEQIGRSQKFLYDIEGIIK